MARRKVNNQPRRLRGEAAASVRCTDPVTNFVSINIIFVTANFNSPDKFSGLPLDNGKRIARTRCDVRRVPVDP
jgi:hypothetical protein